MRIPDIQAEMQEAADDIEWGSRRATKRELHLATKLRRWVKELRRRPRVTNAPTRAKRMSPRIKSTILQLHANHPTFTQQQLSELVGVTAGRVSETLHGGKRL